jgi:hypothetical protein
MPTGHVLFTTNDGEVLKITVRRRNSQFTVESKLWWDLHSQIFNFVRGGGWGKYVRKLALHLISLKPKTFGTGVQRFINHSLATAKSVCSFST